jgi:Uncharacterized conserved protein
MSKQATHVQHPGILDYTATADISVGDVVALGTAAVGIAQTDIASGEAGALVTAGIFDIAAETGVAWAIGDTIYWDSTNKVGTTTATDHARAGIAVAAKASATATGRIALNYSL